MADITWSNVTAHYAELSTVGATVQTDLLAFVNASIDPEMFDGESGYRTKLARINLAAHFAAPTLTSAIGPAGVVSSESADGLSISYAVMTAALGDPSMLGTTKYGQAFLSLVNTSAARGGWVAM